MSESEYIDGVSKWREVVDGDAWFFVPYIKYKGQRGRLGIIGNPSTGVGIYLTTGSGAIEEETFYTKARVKFELTKEEAQELLNIVKECHHFLPKINRENEGIEYLLREMKTQYDAVIHVSAFTPKRLSIKFVLYDSKGEKYVRCAMENTVTLKDESINRFRELLEKAIENCDSEAYKSP